MLKKSLTLLTCLLTSLSYANPSIIRGVNYDPVHSFEFAKAVGLDDQEGMMKAVFLDLDKLAQLQTYNNNQFVSINHIKTFFTQFTSLGASHSAVSINIADAVNQWNNGNPNHKLTLALGVYEFRAGIDGCSTAAICTAWTQAQVQAAIQAANQYGFGLIDKIIVGNEDLNSNLADPKNVLLRVVADIQTIKASINDKRIQVGTAQVSSIANAIITDVSYIALLANADFIGTNLYPFWSGVAYGSANQSPVKAAFNQYWQNLTALLATKNLQNKVIETEEGWPSAGYSVGNAVPNPGSEHDYFYYWYYRDTTNNYIAPVSYYFALFDKLPGQGVESNWGIFSADRNSSILDGDSSKPFASNHPVIAFANQVNHSSKVAILACTDDWNNNTQNQGTCYPLYGYAGTSVIAGGTSRAFMIDTTGQSYTSLMVIYYSGNNGLRLCYINNASLQKITSQSRVTLAWQNASGNAPCQIQ